MLRLFNVCLMQTTCFVVHCNDVLCEWICFSEYTSKLSCCWFNPLLVHWSKWQLLTVHPLNQIPQNNEYRSCNCFKQQFVEKYVCHFNLVQTNAFHPQYVTFIAIKAQNDVFRQLVRETHWPNPHCEILAKKNPKQTAMFWFCGGDFFPLYRFVIKITNFFWFLKLRLLIGETKSKLEKVCNKNYKEYVLHTQKTHPKITNFA